MSESSEKYDKEMSDTRRMFFLTACYICDNMTEAESIELDDLINANDQNMLLFEQLAEKICFNNFMLGLSRRKKSWFGTKFPNLS